MLGIFCEFTVIKEKPSSNSLLHLDKSGLISSIVYKIKKGKNANSAKFLFNPLYRVTP
jgi:hypothetical protein